MEFLRMSVVFTRMVTTDMNIVDIRSYPEAITKYLRNCEHIEGILDCMLTESLTFSDAPESLGMNNTVYLEVLWSNL